MKLIVAGSREFNNYTLTTKYINYYCKYKSIQEIVCGEARGADLLGKRYAEDNNIPVVSFPAEWNKYGKSAGYIRNEAMAKYGTHLIAFWDGISLGTSHMIDLAKSYNLPYRVVYYHK